MYERCKYKGFIATLWQTFKFKEKTYNVKTNSKGIAKISLKNLKVGKYKIYSIYTKSKIKNTITVIN